MLFGSGPVIILNFYDVVSVTPMMFRFNNETDQNRFHLFLIGKKNSYSNAELLDYEH